MSSTNYCTNGAFRSADSSLDSAAAANNDTSTNVLIQKMMNLLVATLLPSSTNQPIGATANATSALSDVNVGLEEIELQRALANSDTDYVARSRDVFANPSTRRDHLRNVAAGFAPIDSDAIAGNGFAESALDTDCPRNRMQFSNSIANTNASASASANGSDVEPTRNCSRLHISNIPFKFREKDVSSLCSRYGKVTDVEIIYNERGSKGFGFVSFATTADAERCKALLNGRTVCGRQLEVNYATMRVYGKKKSKEQTEPSKTLKFNPLQTMLIQLQTQKAPAQTASNASIKSSSSSTGHNTSLLPTFLSNAANADCCGHMPLTVAVSPLSVAMAGNGNNLHSNVTAMDLQQQLANVLLNSTNSSLARTSLSNLASSSAPAASLATSRAANQNTIGLNEALLYALATLPSTHNVSQSVGDALLASLVQNRTALGANSAALSTACRNITNHRFMPY